jgi:hypothetical protein
MATQLRLQIRIEATQANSSTSERRAYRELMLNRRGRHSLDATIEMLTALRDATSLYNREAYITVGSLNQSYADEANAANSNSDDAQAPMPRLQNNAAVLRRLDEVHAMCTRLLMPEPIRTLPNADDAMAVLNLDNLDQAFINNEDI